MRIDAETVTRRGQSKAPIPLAQFIEAANVNPGHEYVDIGELVAAVDRDARRRPERRNPLLVDRCSALLAELPQPAREFIGRPDDLRVFCQKYRELKLARETLLAITLQSRKAVSFAEHKAIRQIAGRLRERLPFVSVSVDLVENQRGEIQRVPGLLEALEGTSVDRIRACAICSAIFWATRRNSDCCTEKCRKTYNQRNSREARRAQETVWTNASKR
jgi:hypothetical protein